MTKKPETGRDNQKRSSNLGAHKAAGKSKPVMVENYIRGIDYPANKNELISKARQNDAPENVMRALNKIADQEYNSPVDITKAMSGDKASNE